MLPRTVATEILVGGSLNKRGERRRMPRQMRNALVNIIRLKPVPSFCSILCIQSGCKLMPINLDIPINTNTTFDTDTR